MLRIWTKISMKRVLSKEFCPFHENSGVTLALEIPTGWPPSRSFPSGPLPTSSSSYALNQFHSLAWQCCLLYWSPPIGPKNFLQSLNRSVVVLEMSFDRACRAHSGLVCVATWNCRGMTSESSSVLRMACRRMTSRVFALLTPSLVSRSSQAASIAEPRTPTVKLN